MSKCMQQKRVGKSIVYSQQPILLNNIYQTVELSSSFRSIFPHQELVNWVEWREPRIVNTGESTHSHCIKGCVRQPPASQDIFFRSQRRIAVSGLTFVTCEFCEFRRTMAFMDDAVMMQSLFRDLFHRVSADQPEEMGNMKK